MEPLEIITSYAAGERDFSDASLRGANLREAQLKFIGLNHADLMWANLISADLSGASLKEANLVYANLKNADLSNAELRGANLSGAILNDINLMRADLRGANLRGAILNGANLRLANLRGADLSGANLSEANLRNSDLRNAILWTTNLSHANLSLSDLTDANVSYAFFYCSDLTDAKLSGVNITEAKIEGANVKGTILDPQRRKTRVIKQADAVGEELDNGKKFIEITPSANHDQNLFLYNQDNSNTQVIHTEKILPLFHSSNSTGHLDWTTPLRSQQAEFIQRANMGNLFHSQIDGTHSEITIISGQKLDQLRDFCWKLTAEYSLKIVDNYGRLSLVQQVFINSIKGKLAQEVIKTRLGDLVSEIDYQQLLKSMDRNGNADFVLGSKANLNIRIKAVNGCLQTVRWTIEEEDLKKKSVLVCFLIKEEVSEDQGKYSLILAGFLPTEMIYITHGEGLLGMSQLLYAGGLRSYLESYIN